MSLKYECIPSADNLGKCSIWASCATSEHIYEDVIENLTDIVESSMIGVGLSSNCLKGRLRIDEYVSGEILEVTTYTLLTVTMSDMQMVLVIPIVLVDNITDDAVFVETLNAYLTWPSDSTGIVFEPLRYKKDDIYIYLCNLLLEVIERNEELHV